MKKILVVGLAASLVFGSLTSAEAGKKKKPKKVQRVEEQAYIAPAYFYWAPSGDNIGGVKFTTGPTDNFVSIEIEDSTGMDVSASVGQDPEGDGTVATTRFCTKTEEPLPIEPGLEVTVFVFVGPCTQPPGPAVATQGTVIGTFSNLP
jgi:hypothetical protein